MTPAETAVKAAETVAWRREALDLAIKQGSVDGSTPEQVIEVAAKFYAWLTG